MVGVKGKSGRKPNPYGEQSRNKKISFYVKENRFGDGWIEDQDFHWFKRHHGSEWQKVIRRFMRTDAFTFRDKHWPCNCPRLNYQNLRHWREAKCFRCNSYKSENARRQHEGPQ